MANATSEFIRRFELSLLDTFSVEQVKEAINRCNAILSDYTIESVSRELIVYNDENERLIMDFAGCQLIAGKAKRTVENYIRHLKNLYNYTGINLLEMPTDKIRGYIAQQLVKGLKKSSVNNIRNAIAPFYKWAYSEELIAKNPCEFIGGVKCEEEVKLPFSDVELDRIRHGTNNLRDRAIIEVLLSSGVRAEELVNLNICDIDFGTLRLFVHKGKGSKDRITYISKVAKYHLEKYLKSRTDNLDALFLNYPNRSDKYIGRISSSGLRTILRRLSKKLDIENIHPHRFRRTFATSMYKRGMTVTDIQQLLGHNDISTTMRYIYIDDTTLQTSYLKHIA